MFRNFGSKRMERNMSGTWGAWESREDLFQDNGSILVSSFEFWMMGLLKSVNSQINSNCQLFLVKIIFDYINRTLAKKKKEKKYQPPRTASLHLPDSHWKAAGRRNKVALSETLSACQGLESSLKGGEGQGAGPPCWRLVFLFSFNILLKSNFKILHLALI